MYAIITDGGRQYKVTEGQHVDIDYRNVSTGEQIKFDRVVAVSGDGGVELGHPLVEGASVTAEVLGVNQGKKIYVQKFRRRKNSRRRTGHRQLYTKVRIDKIESAQAAADSAIQPSHEPTADETQQQPQDS